MRKLLVLIACFVQVGFLLGQQEAHYTQFMYNKQALNPGFAGARRVASVTALYRNQWMGFNGSPTSYHVGMEGPFFADRLGSSLVLGSQSEGIIRRLYGNLGFSYDILHTDATSLRIGLSGSMRHYRFDLSNPDVYIKDRLDQSLPAANTSQQLIGNIGAGAYFDHKSFYLGFSVPNLYRNYIALNENPAATSTAQEQRHLYFMAGAFFPLGSENVQLKPSIMAKYVQNSPFSLDMNLSVMFNKRFSTGLSYRYGQSGGAGDSVDFLAFVQATDRLGIGAAYDFTVSGLRNYNKGSVEALVRYDLGKTKENSKAPTDREKKSMSNPRYFF